MVLAMVLSMDELCREPGAMCGYVEKALALSNWERRLAVITRDGKLVIYKYYLLDICPGEPLMGKTYQLNKVKYLHLERFENGDIISRIKTMDGKRVKLKLTGEYATAWAAKIIHIQGAAVGHHSHPNKSYSHDVSLKSDDGIFVSVRTSSSQSDSNESKFSYAITLDDYSEPLHESTKGTRSVIIKHLRLVSNTAASKLPGDVPSVLQPSESERARGGKVREEENVTELIHSILTKSTRASNRKKIQNQLEELIRLHMIHGKIQNKKMSQRKKKHKNEKRIEKEERKGKKNKTKLSTGSVVIEAYRIGSKDCEWKKNAYINVSGL
ncbi:hypothetical protein DICVIV_09094 [Dictyocaulus viviparus]|uniref:PH-15 domain-containing protein n=1 Tax=Dictyocaulus viviparus TaxID=29172 RepID=A0A0D8XMA2_DICVI|nr:hypothetical protein DICVIV_09094 [Dictyocaulus viviparus]